MRLRDFNAFILTGAALFVIGVIGIFKGNRWLSEPGMPTNPYGWQLYLAASVLMLINGVASIKVARAVEAQRSAGRPAPESAPSQTEKQIESTGER